LGCHATIHEQHEAALKGIADENQEASQLHSTGKHLTHVASSTISNGEPLFW
jgi:hypothetical protein